MPDLAGFDVIAEVHIDTVVDLVNSVAITNPTDGKSIYLLGGPVSTDLTMNLGFLGTVALRVVMDAQLRPVVHQPLARLGIAISGGSTTVAGRDLYEIGGLVTVDVPLGFAPLANGQPGPGAANPQAPVLLVGPGKPEVVLDDRTIAQANGTLGPGGSELLAAGIGGALAALMAAAGPRSIQMPKFWIVPGIDSKKPDQLSAVPVVAWIDSETLGIFGYYRAAAIGGNIAAKAQGDITQAHDDEYFYDQPGVDRLVPGRRVALLLAGDAFEQVIAGPAVNDVVRGLVESRDHDGWVARVSARDGGSVLAEQTNAHLQQYFTEELLKNILDVGGDLERAKARVQADVDAIIDARAHAEQDDWLDNTPQGQQAITDATPPPFGSGAVQIVRQHVSEPTVQSDLVAMLRKLDVRLGTNNVAVHYEADAFLEDLFGDISIFIAGDMEITVAVSELGTVTSDFDLQPPTVDVQASGLTGDLLDILKPLFSRAGAWGIVMGFLSLVVKARATDSIAQRFPYDAGTKLINGMPQAPFPTRMVDVNFDPTSLRLVALVCHHPVLNQFDPGVTVETTVSRTPADLPGISSNLRFGATEWGCPPAQFETTRSFWNTTIGVRARTRDIPMPLTVLGWMVELGNFSLISPGPILDPRPVWSSAPSELTAGLLTLTGKVNHPDPPIVLIAGSTALGSLQLREDVRATVTGDAENGWQVGFNGEEGNFYVRFSVEIRDGDGVQWHGETFVTVVGDQFEVPAAYGEYKAACDAKYQQWLRLMLAAMGKLVAVGKVLPGQPVMSGEIRESIAVQTLVTAGDPAGLRQLVSGVARFGPGMLRQIGQVSPLTLVTGPR